MFHRVNFRLAFFAMTDKDSFFASLPDVDGFREMFDDPLSVVRATSRFSLHSTEQLSTQTSRSRFKRLFVLIRSSLSPFRSEMGIFAVSNSSE